MTQYRFLTFIFVLGLQPFSMAFATTALTEAMLIQAIQNQPDLVEIEQKQTQVAQLKHQQAGRWSDPRIELTQERLERTQGNELETSLWLKQALMPWGMSGIEKRSAEQHAILESIELQRKQQVLRLELRTLFYQALAIQQEQQALGLYHQQLMQMTAKVEKRWQSGDASKFDLLRLQTELKAIDAEKNVLHATLNTIKQTLANWTGTPVESFTGHLLPKSPNLDVVHLENNPQLQSMNAKTNLALVLQEAAEKQRYWPDVSIGVGYKQSTETGNQTEGYKVGLEMSIPLFSQKQDAVELAQTQADQTKAEKQFLQQTLEAEQNKHLANVQLHQAQAQTWQALLEQNQESLINIAQTSYDSGELSVTELLNVYHTQLTHHKNYLSSALTARNHYIQLQNTLGE